MTTIIRSQAAPQQTGGAEGRLSKNASATVLDVTPVTVISSASDLFGNDV
jgi:hypothetical protein